MFGDRGYIGENWKVRLTEMVFNSSHELKEI